MKKTKFRLNSRMNDKLLDFRFGGVKVWIIFIHELPGLELVVVHGVEHVDLFIVLSSSLPLL